MRDAYIVTGPIRSGTSCVTGLLEACGFDLGRNVRVLRNPTPMNPRGHFEADLLFAVNSRLLTEAGSSGITEAPDPKAITTLIQARKRYFQLFLKKFDGELCKDPLFCFTLDGWRRHWPTLRHAVFCLRHPLAVAHSMARRYGLPPVEGLSLWADYCRAFMAQADGLAVYWLDFDHFCHDPLLGLENLLEWLGRPLERKALAEKVDGFFIPPAQLLPPSADNEALEEKIAGLYQDLKQRCRNNGR